MFTFTSFVDALLKARGHKYIKRIPYMSGGKKRYRYIYKVTHTHRGRQAFDAEHLDVGTAFALHTEAGAEFHGHITAVKGDQVTYRIDDGERKGESVTVSKSELLSQLNDVHGIESKLNAERDKLRSQIEVAREKGSAKQVKRLEERLARLGGEQKRAESKGELKGRYAEIFEKHAVSPDMVALDRWYSKKPRSLPDRPMYERLEELAPRSAEACERYNRGLKRALSEIQEAMNERLTLQAPIIKAIENAKPSITEIEENERLTQELAQEVETILRDAHAQGAGYSLDELARRDPDRVKRTSRAFRYATDPKVIPYYKTRVLNYITLGQLKENAPEAVTRLRELLGDAFDTLDDFDRPAPVIRDFAKRERITYKGKTLGLERKYREVRRLEDQRNEIRAPAELVRDLIFDGSGDDASGVEIDEIGVKGARGGQAPKIIAQFTREMKRHYRGYAEGMKRVTVEYKRANARASCVTTPEGDARQAEIELASNDEPSTMLHEIAHTLEYFAPEVVDAVTLTHATRVKAGRSSKYHKREKTFDDDYHDVYAGKLYDGKPSSELVTMGVQEFVSAERALKLHDTDPHHFAVTYAILKGYFSDEN